MEIEPMDNPDLISLSLSIPHNAFSALTFPFHSMSLFENISAFEVIPDKPET